MGNTSTIDGNDNSWEARSLQQSRNQRMDHASAFICCHFMLRHGHFSGKSETIEAYKCIAKSQHPKCPTFIPHAHKQTLVPRENTDPQTHNRARTNPPHPAPPHFTPLHSTSLHATLTHAHTHARMHARTSPPHTAPRHAMPRHATHTHAHAHKHPHRRHTHTHRDTHRERCAPHVHTSARTHAFRTPVL